MTDYKTTILWGECPEPDQEPITYKFETQEELNAFMRGVNAMDGWLGFEVIYSEEEMKQNREIYYEDHFGMDGLPSGEFPNE